MYKWYAKMDSWKNPARETQTRILEEYVFALYWLSRSALLHPVRTLHKAHLSASRACPRSGVVCSDRAIVILMKPRRISPGP